MANPACTLCEQYAGVLMATNLDNGDTQIACGNCLPAYALGMAAAMTQGMTAEQATQYADALDVIYANDPRRPKIDRLRPKGKRALAAVADVPPDGSEAAAAAMAALPPPVPDRAPDGDVLTIDAGGQVWPSDDRAQLPAESRAAPQAVPLPEPCHACGAEFAHGDGDELVCDGCGLVLATDDGGA